jgi:hypothetical protein
MRAEASAGVKTNREADEPRAIESLRRFVGACNVRIRIVAIVQFFWIAALFAEDSKPSIERYLHDLGIGLLALDGAMALLTFVAGHRRAAAPAATRVVRPLAPGRAIECAERAHWAEAALTRFAAEAVADGPEISLLRVGTSGVEMLLTAPCPDVPPGFEPLEDGAALRLDPSITLDDLEAAAHGDGGDGRLVAIGSDPDGTYFRDDPASPPHRRPAVGADLVQVDDGDAVVLEPYGLRLARTTGTARTSGRPTNRARIAARLADEESSGLSLVAAGAVEVRILRELPDLVGAVTGDASAAAVELVAYLATHRHRATAARLRDALGTPRSPGSQAASTIWAVAGAARKVLGPDRLTSANGSQPYRLADDVSCDWLRFQELVNTAAAGDDERREALVAALELVRGVPAAASNRFTWLDTEGTLAHVAREVAAAAKNLATLALDQDCSTELAAWALEKGRLLDPDAEELSEVEARLRSLGIPVLKRAIRFGASV